MWTSLLMSIYCSVLLQGYTSSASWWATRKYLSKFGLSQYADQGIGGHDRAYSEGTWSAAGKD